MLQTRTEFRICALLGLALCAVPGFAQSSLNDFFNDSVVQQVSLTVNPNDWATMLANYEDNTYYHAQLSWGNLSLSVGIRNHGSASRSPVKPNIDVNISKYVKNQNFLGITFFVLKANNEDPSNLHEWLAFKFFQRMGIPAPREAPAEMSVNGAYFGFYMVVEHLDDGFLVRNYGESGGYLYEWESSNLTPFYFQILGSDPSVYAPYLNVKSDQANPDLDNFSDFVNTVNDSPGDSFIGNVSPYIDPGLYLEYGAIENMLAEKDGLWSDYVGTNNICLYQFQGTSLYTISPWDNDQTFSDAERPIEQGIGANALASRLFAIAQYRQVYLATLARAAEAFGGPGGWADQELTKEYNLIASAAENDPHKQCLLLNPTTGACPANAFQDEVNNVRRIVETRAAFILEQAAQVGYQPIESAPEIDDVSAQASEGTGLVAGSMAVMSGERLGAVMAASGPIPPRELGSTYVTVNGERASLTSVSDGQIVFEIPGDIPAGLASAVAVVNGILSNSHDIYIVSTAIQSGSGLVTSISSLDFGDQKAVTWSAGQTVTVTNGTGAAIAIDGITIGGANPEDFSQSNQCVGMLGPRTSCTANVIFTPQLIGTRRAALVVTGDSSSQTVTLTGRGSVTGSFEIVNSLTGKALEVTPEGGNGEPVEENALNGGRQQEWQLIPAGDGSYQLVNGATGKALDLTGGSGINGARIQQWDALGTSNQHWEFVPVDDVHYMIVNQASGKVLDLTGGSPLDGTMIQQWDYLANSQQLWVILPAGPNTITNSLSGKVLEAPSGAAADGTLIQQNGAAGDPAQNWQLMPVGNGYYAVLNGSTGKALDVQGESVANGAVIQEYEYLQGANQQWQIVPLDSQNRAIVNRLSGKALDNTGSSTSDGTNVQQWEYLGNANQQWQIAPVKYYTIVNRSSGAALDLPGGSAADGTPLQQWSLDGFEQQEWQLVAADSGYVGLVNKASAKAMGVGSAASNGAPVEQQGSYKPDASEQWLLSQIADGYLTITNRSSGKVLDVEGASAANGAAIQQWDYLSGANQQWQLVPAEN